MTRASPGAAPAPMSRLRALAAAHPGGYADLATASPVDPPPERLLDALASAPPAPGYPSAHGARTLRETVTAWLRRCRGAGALDPAQVVPTIGSKEFLGLLPFLLGLGPGDTVVVPELAYPAYAAGAAAVGATALPEDDPGRWPASTRLVWLNSPRNPDGKVLSAAELRRAVERARELGAVVVDDECYGVLAADGDTRVPSILLDAANGGSLDRVLMCASVSKQSNLAGYRAGFAAGDPDLVHRIVARRRELGLIVPAPVQHLLGAALADDAHVARQRTLNRDRIARLRPAVEAAGLRVEGSTAGMYLWATGDEDGWATAERLAVAGILCTPGVVFGGAGRRHVRFAVTVEDHWLDRAVERLERLRASGPSGWGAPAGAAKMER